MSHYIDITSYMKSGENLDQLKSGTNFKAGQNISNKKVEMSNEIDIKFRS